MALRCAPLCVALGASALLAAEQAQVQAAADAEQARTESESARLAAEQARAQAEADAERVAKEKADAEAARDAAPNSSSSVTLVCPECSMSSLLQLAEAGAFFGRDDCHPKLG